ncbi:MAG: 1-deoxy-D-xylulose-5-phosphate synthase [Candidatus Omnitrophota bacterium]
MLLGKIESPKDLKTLNLKQLGILCQEIREKIIQVVSCTGGHLASSLGAVELVVSLHYCLNTPQDIIIWDVGHQAYAHKIITGRNKNFQSLRQFKGISGFPNKDESVYDPFSTGHSSTAVSLALGEVIARDLNNKKNKVVAVIGDGSLTGGLCFEALNHAGHLKKDILVILNSNDMAISPSVGALSNYLNKIISAPIYNRLRVRISEELDVFTKKAPRLGKLAKEAARRFEEGLKNLIVPGIFFEELGFRYFGPLDGHNLELVTHTLKNIIDLKGPVLLHVVTQKGKGYEFAEKNPVGFHSTAPFEIENGKPKQRAGAETLVSASTVFGQKLVELAKENKRIVTITAAMAEGTGLCNFRDSYPDRFFDVGIAEAHAVAMASGLAREGLKPVVAIYSTFLQRAYDQIVEELALQKANCVLALDRAGLGEDGPTHHGLFDISYLRHIPDLVIMAPSYKEELEMMLEFAISYNSGPIVMRYPKKIPVLKTGPSPKIELGKASVIREGHDIGLIATGGMVDVAVKVADILFREEGLSSTVVDARFIKPLDIETIRAVFSKTNVVFTLEESVLAGGFGSGILEAMSLDEGLKENAAALNILALGDEFITYGKREQLLNISGLGPKIIAAKIRNKVAAVKP